MEAKGGDNVAGLATSNAMKNNSTNEKHVQVQVAAACAVGEVGSAPTNGKNSGTITTTSGYAADIEQVYFSSTPSDFVQPPPDYIDLHRKTKNSSNKRKGNHHWKTDSKLSSKKPALKPPTGVVTHHLHYKNKNRKAAESQFEAKNVKADLARGGLPVPSFKEALKTNSSSNIVNPASVLAEAGIDFRKHTKLLLASEVKDSPFLAGVTPQMSSVYDTHLQIAAWNDLIKSSSKFYADNDNNNAIGAATGATGNSATPKENEDEKKEKGRNETNTTDNNNNSNNNNSSSSSSSNKSDADNCSTSSLTSSCESEAAKPTKVASTNSSTCPKKPQSVHRAIVPAKSFITLHEALGFSKKPRLLVLSSHPFMIVHINAEFTRLTGLSSANVLGKPFTDIVSDGDKTLVEASFTVFSMRIVHDIIFNLITAPSSDNKDNSNSESQQQQYECVAKVKLIGDSGNGNGGGGGKSAGGTLSSPVSRATASKQYSRSESSSSTTALTKDVSHFSVDVCPIDAATFNDADFMNPNDIDTKLKSVAAVDSALPTTASLLVG